MGETSPSVDAFMKFPGIETNSIKDPAVRRAFGIINEYFKRVGVFSDQDAKQATIDGNVAAIALNTTHRSSIGSDHADVVNNTTHRSSSGVDHADVVSNTTHRSSNGSDHGWLNQNVQTTAAVNFFGLSLGIGGADVNDISANTSLGTSDTKLATQKAIKAYVDAEVATKMDDLVSALQALNATIPTSPTSVNINEFYRELGGDVKWKVL